MGKAGYCTACGQNVYLTAGGECTNGHPANCITGVYETPEGANLLPDTPMPGPSSVLTKKVNPLLVVVILLGTLAVCVVFGVLANTGSNPATPTSQEPAPAAATNPAPEAESAPEPEPEPVTAAAVADEAWGKFTPVKKSGRGDSVVPLPTGASAGIVTASHTGSANFVVQTLSADNAELDLLVNEIGKYRGSTFYIESMDKPTRLKITADGPWTVSISPVSTGKQMSAKTTGKGDAVLLYDGEAADWSITHAGQANFVVKRIGTDSEDLLVNEIGKYSGTLPVGSGPAIVILNADGTWSIGVD